MAPALDSPVPRHGLDVRASTSPPSQPLCADTRPRTLAPAPLAPHSRALTTSRDEYYASHASGFITLAPASFPSPCSTHPILHLRCIHIHIRYSARTRPCASLRAIRRPEPHRLGPPQPRVHYPRVRAAAADRHLFHLFRLVFAPCNSAPNTLPDGVPAPCRARPSPLMRTTSPRTRRGCRCSVRTFLEREDAFDEVPLSPLGGRGTSHIHTRDPSSTLRSCWSASTPAPSLPPPSARVGPPPPLRP
ncbi:hypothetical protein DFH08DRAFT_1083720 [Mycena albidolilacea]|uniref:Uncharacterized protein n=1 Tax=Mycena albidolilacea TaxID=1033008 RepID=A0AAD6ZQJ0_9AGAR|nr:hypothetical protein DFH08DRAFT_1083720 [Mycena albidolilacea]